MRGKRLKREMHRADDGITPAHAGKTHSFFPRSGTGRDHPRACGENMEIRDRQTGERGSPPRMRGKLGIIGETDVNLGITPAHAGKTNPEPYRPRCPKDHPRACGENLE